MGNIQVDFWGKIFAIFAFLWILNGLYQTSSILTIGEGEGEDTLRTIINIAFFQFEGLPTAFNVIGALIGSIGIICLILFILQVLRVF